MKNTIALVGLIIIALSSNAQLTNIEKENFVIIYNTCFDITAEISFINKVSCSKIGDNIILDRPHVAEVIETKTDYYLEYGKPKKAVGSEETDTISFINGIAQTEFEIGKFGQFTNVKSLSFEFQDSKIVKIISYRNASDVKYQFFFEYNNKGQIIKKKEIWYDDYYSLNNVTKKENTYFKYDSENRLVKCTIHKVENDKEEDPYILYEWKYSYNEDMRSLSETIAIDYFEKTFKYIEYDFDDRDGWLEKRVHVGNKATKEWILDEVYSREYNTREEIERRNSLENIISKIKLKLDGLKEFKNFDFLNEEAKNNLANIDNLSIKSIEAAIYSNEKVICNDTDIVAIYRNQSQGIYEKYNPIFKTLTEHKAYVYFPKLEKLSLSLNHDLELLTNKMSQLLKYQIEQAKQFKILKEKILVNHSAITDKCTSNGEPLKDNKYLFEYYKYLYEKSELSDLKVATFVNEFQQYVIKIIPLKSKDLEKALKKAEDSKSKYNAIINYI